MHRTAAPFLASLMLSCAHAPAAAGLASPVRVELAPYLAGLRTIEVEVKGKKERFLFDTGGGVTALSPELAAAVGCTPFGRITVHRMSGERLDLERCGVVELAIQGVPIRTEAVVLDIATLLPKEWPRLAGVVSLSTLEALPFTLDLRNGHLELESTTSLAARTPAMQPLEFRASRPAGGFVLDIFIAAPGKPAPVWFLLDSGNVYRVVVAPHAAKMLGIEPAATTLPSLEVSGIATSSIAAAIEEIIYDGNFGAAFIERFVFSFDLAAGQAWIAGR